MKKILTISSMFLSIMFAQFELSFDDVFIGGVKECVASGEDDPNGLTSTVGGCAGVLAIPGFDCETGSWAGIPLSELCPITCFDEANCPGEGEGSFSVIYSYDTVFNDDGTPREFAGFQFDLVGEYLVMAAYLK